MPKDHEVKHAELPDGPFLTLCEFFSWAVEGEAISDADIKSRAVALAEQDRKEWWCSLTGPEWLFNVLSSINSEADLLQVPPLRDGEYSTYDLRLARSWFVKRGRPFSETINEIGRETEARRKRAHLHNELERLLFGQAAIGDVTLKGRKVGKETSIASAEYETIPAEFFLRPCKFFNGLFKGPSELVRWTDDGDPNWLMDSVFNRDDPPVTYIEVKIARDDAIRLKAAWEAAKRPTPALSTARSETSCLRWLTSIIAQTGADERYPGTRAQLWTEAKAKFPELSEAGFKRALAGAKAATPNRPNFLPAGAPVKAQKPH